MNNEKTRILAHLQAIRENRPGHFWAGAFVTGISLFGMVAAFGTAPDTNEIRAFQRSVHESLVLTPVAQGGITAASFVREERIQRGG